ncbi:translation initiation factor eIF2B subunit beta [Onthophagus taurus]|uniref:translation initiation factor eIF2B subunit beta n=1 Tax=Onthophagus taurus TaxID=166361 RepID=UPI000C20998C|nr:translation initiation factor eIF-2B subunit beta [Onthophagus taurus]
MEETDNLKDIMKLITDIKVRRVKTSYDIALKTEKLIENYIAVGKWNTARDLMGTIRKYMETIKQYLPHEATINNVMRHILKIIRDEYDLGFKNKGDESTLYALLTSNPDDQSLKYGQKMESLKTALLDHLSEYKTELETSADNIASQAADHIHTNEIILTIGQSDTVTKFLLQAAKTRKFQVIVVESAPNYDGHNMAVNLANHNIQTTVIPDACIFAMMSRVNKVIIGTHTVMADGSLRSVCGVHTVTLAAQHYSIPVICLVHMYKLSTIYATSPEHPTFNILGSPGAILPYSSGPILNKVHVYNPVFDHVEPELISLFVTHQGGNTPSYVYHMLSELYHPDDYEL